MQQQQTPANGDTDFVCRLFKGALMDVQMPNCSTITAQSHHPSNHHLKCTFQFVINNLLTILSFGIVILSLSLSHSQ